MSDAWTIQFTKTNAFDNFKIPSPFCIWNFPQSRIPFKGFPFNLPFEEIHSLLNCMHFSSEIPDHADCALSRELMGFSLKEENDCWVTEQQSVENSGLGPSAEKKILFQHHTVLDRHMVSCIRSNQEKISNLPCISNSNYLDKYWPCYDIMCKLAL